MLRSKSPLEVGTYTYLWNTNGATGSTLNDLAAGWYSVTATETGSGCYHHTNVEIEYDPTCNAIISGYIYDDDSLQLCIRRYIS